MVNNRKQERTCIDESVMETGNEVGNLAKNLFGEYVEVPYSREHQEMLDKTEKLMDNGTHIIA